MGIQRSQSAARQTMYWQSMYNDIYNIVSNCKLCARYKNANPKQELQAHDIIDIPWYKLGCDIFEFEKKKYLLVVDYYSKYIEIDLLSSGFSAKEVKIKFKSIFARHGIPHILISDNGPPFSSKEFQEFCVSWHIKHLTSSPYLSRSNGLAERSIQTIKKLLTKATESKSDPYLALLSYRNTPKSNMPSPAQLLMSRVLRTQMPVFPEYLKPELVDNDWLKELRKQKQSKSSENYNKSTKSLPAVENGEVVMFKKTPTALWVPGKIKNSCEEPRSFLVEDNQGVSYRRNREHIMKRPQPQNSFEIDPNKIESTEKICEKIVSQSSENNTEEDLRMNEQLKSESSQKSTLSENEADNDSRNRYVTKSGREVYPPVRLEYKKI